MLTLAKKSLKAFETAKSKSDRNDPNFEPDWIRYRFIAHATCSQCGEPFVFAGSGSVDMEVKYGSGNDFDFEFVENFTPSICEPMPDMIEFPAKSPEGVVDELRYSFRLFWLNPNAAAGRIRCALERLMDFLKMPTTRINKKGKPVRIDLHERIQEFGKVDATQAGHLMALKIVGNTGSHQASLSKDDVLDALEVIEHALEEIIDKRSVRIARLAMRLKTRHGGKSSTP